MIEINNRTRSKVDEMLIKTVSEQFLKSQNLKEKTVSIGIVGDTVMRNLNRQYRKMDKATDILSFKSEEEADIVEEKDYLGELIIDLAQIKRQAPRYSRSFRDEFIFILVHGLLHLAGYEDETEAGRLEMIKKGNEIIKTKIKDI